MAQEIERKWLVKLTGPLAPKRTRVIESGYLTVADPEVRVARYRSEEGSYQITVKKGAGLQRQEIVCDIPDEQGLELFTLAEHRVSKLRDDIPRIENEREVGHPWEIDTYLDRWMGVHVAEIELASVRVATPMVPKGVFLLKEVTDDPRWKNKYMASCPEHERIAMMQEYFAAVEESKNLVRKAVA